MRFNIQEDTNLPLFKSFRAPKANISMSVSKDQLNLGEAIEGTATITSQEAFEADEIRIELLAYETLRPGGGLITDNQEKTETRMYSPPRQNTQTSASVTYAMYKRKTAIAPNLPRKAQRWKMATTKMGYKSSARRRRKTRCRYKKRSMFIPSTPSNLNGISNNSLNCGYCV